MNAWDELDSTGDVGPACYALFLARARREARRFPPPTVGSGWTDDDVVELVQDVFGARGSAVTIALLGAPNEDRLEALVTTMVQNRLRDRAKMTEVGKLRRRLGRMLEADARFAQDEAGRWHLADRSSESTALDRDVLVAAAHAVRGITLDLPLNPAGKTSRANTTALTAISEAVLTVGGAVGEQDLAHAVASRCQLLVTPPMLLSEELESAAGPDDGDQTYERRLAREIVLRLTDAERRAVLHLAGVEVPHRGDGPRQRRAVCERLAALIGELVDDAEARGQVLSEVVMLLRPRPADALTITSSDPDEVASATPSSGEVTS